MCFGKVLTRIPLLFQQWNAQPFLLITDMNSLQPVISKRLSRWKKIYFNSANFGMVRKFRVDFFHPILDNWKCAKLLHKMFRLLNSEILNCAILNQKCDEIRYTNLELIFDAVLENWKRAKLLHEMFSLQNS